MSIVTRPLGHDTWSDFSRLVEAFPEDISGRKVTAAFLFNGSLAMFQDAGFSPSRQIGKHKWLVTRMVAAFP